MKNRRDHYTENRESDLGEIERTRKELAFVVRVEKQERENLKGNVRGNEKGSR